MEFTNLRIYGSLDCYWKQIANIRKEKWIKKMEKSEKNSIEIDEKITESALWSS